MNLFENIRIALRALAANKLRSGLTMLGIIIGVAAVVALMAVGAGATAGITSSIQGLGTNMISVTSGRAFSFSGMGGRSSDSQQLDPLYYSDYQAIQSAVGSAAEVTPFFQDAGNVISGGLSSSFSVTGVTANFAEVRAYDIAQGRFITDNDNKSEARVAVLGYQTAIDLFSGLNPIGREIQINGITFTIVGVLESKGSTGFFSQDDLLAIPLQTGYSRLFSGRAISNGKRTLSGVNLSAKDPEQIDAIISQVEYTLRRQHQLTLNDELGFNVSSQSQMLSALSGVTGTLTAMLGAIAAISLLVGGIGIMNITLVSVRERTREIGLRKAVGARRNVILMQFLVETLTLSIFGGILGILLGWAIAALVSASGVITAVLTPNNVLLAFGSAALVGLFFGIYPAYQAAGLRPIEALRYE
ncbi:MAG: ABC transporter permease [Anaerolineales bacterium]|jgi:putative ABC transport system permease protein